METRQPHFYQQVCNTSYYQGAVGFIEGLWERGCKRLMLVRTDLLIRSEYQQSTSIFDIVGYRARLWNNRRSKPSIFRHCLGWIWCIEYTEECGYHLHCLFVFDADHVQQDVYYGDAIGDYWYKVITNGEGCYHNCNRDRDDYRYPGIGRVQVDDEARLANLYQYVIPYLAKEDGGIREAIRQDGEALGRDTGYIRTFGYSHNLCL